MVKNFLAVLGLFIVILMVVSPFVSQPESAPTTSTTTFQPAGEITIDQWDAATGRQTHESVSESSYAPFRRNTAYKNDEERLRDFHRLIEMRDEVMRRGY